MSGKADFGSGLFDQGQSHGVFMRRKIIHDHHIARAQCRTQSGGHKFGTLLCQWLSMAMRAMRAIPPDGTDHRGGLPVAAAWREPAPRRGASAQPTHVGLGSRFIRGRSVWTGRAPLGRVATCGALAQCLERSCSLARVSFLYVSPSLAKHSGWQAAYNPWPDAVPPRSDPASAPKAASLLLARGKNAWLGTRKAVARGQCLPFAGAAVRAS